MARTTTSTAKRNSKLPVIQKRESKQAKVCIGEIGRWPRGNFKLEKKNFIKVPPSEMQETFQNMLLALGLDNATWPES